MNSVKRWDLHSRISALLGTKHMSDITFEVGNPPVIFPCHKLILGINSEVFHAMLYGNMPQTESISVPDITSGAFKLVLEYCYTNKVSIKNTEDAFDAAYAAKKYMISPLYRKCEDYLICNTKLSYENVFSIYEDANFLNMENMMHKAMNYICRHFNQLFCHSSLSSVSKSTVIEILQSNALGVESESDVLEAVCSWGKMQCSEDENSACLREAINDLLYYVRFPLISKLEFEILTSKHNIFDASERELLLHGDAGKTKSYLQMPFGISKSKIERSISHCEKMELPANYRYNDTSYQLGLTRRRQQILIRVLIGQVTIVGVIITSRPIAEYSKNHRMLNVELTCTHQQRHSQSITKMITILDHDNEEMQQQLILDQFFVISTGESCTLNISFESEGVLLPLLLEKRVTKTMKSTTVLLTIPEYSGINLYTAFKEMMCMFQ